ncbi:MAG TPA: protease pro-enzyme activation domain-containing protein, partial [Casimicrobiaceae bacterium]
MKRFFRALPNGLRCAALIVLGMHAMAANAEADASRVSLPGHVLPLLAQATPGLAVATRAKDARMSEPLTLTVVLRRSNPAGFAAYLEDVYDHGSPNFRHFLSPAQVTERFGPSADDYNAVAGYFADRGFVLSEGSANRMTLTFTGTRAAADAALGVDVKDYTFREHAFFANDTDPSLPAGIASRVEAVVGLSSLAVPRPTKEALKAAYCAAGAWIAAVEPLHDAAGKDWAPSSDALRNKLYIRCMIDQKASGYGADKKVDPPPPAWQGADGTGQTVGVVAFDTLVMSDVSDYIQLAGLPANTINHVSNVHVNGGASAGASQDEVLLDVDEIISTAPGTRVVVYDGPFGGANASFQAIFNKMIGDGVDIISNSWAYCEDQTTLADVQSIDTILQTAAASGISAFTGSGDHGSTCLDGSGNTVHVPASSPHITAVGGSSLSMGPGSTYGSETWWDSSASTPPGGQGGYGTSGFFTRPAYQDGATVSAMRSIPDVVSNADPAKGAQICQASAGGCPSGLYYGGTSKSAPSWAAFAAMLNQSQG